VLAIDGTEPTGDDADKPDAARVGLRLLRLLAEAADLRGPHWVHRRVSQLEFLDTRAVRWRVSVDFDVPADAPVIKDSKPERRLVPLATWSKGDLVAFDFRDEQDASIPLLTSEWTSSLMAAGLRGWAEHLFPKGAPDWVPADLKQTVSEVGVPNDSQTEAPSSGENRPFRHQLEELAGNFVVLAAVASPPGSRRIVKLSLESAVTFRRPQGMLRRLGMSMGLLYWRLEVPFGGRGGSHHLEVAAPTGVEIYKITTEPAFPDKLEESSKPTAITAGGSPHVPIRVPAGPRRYIATIFVRVARRGWLTASWAVSLVIAGVMVLAWTNLPVLFPKTGGPGQASTAASLLLAFLGLIATWLIQPGQHPLAGRLLLAARGFILADVAAVLVGVGNLIVHVSPHPPNVIWGVLAILSIVIAALLTLTWLLPRQRKLQTIDAPHREKATPIGNAAMPPRRQRSPGSVSIPAADGRHHGDDDRWTSQDQQALVDALKKAESQLEKSAPKGTER
jgi:hypothetical protein